MDGHQAGGQGDPIGTCPGPIPVTAPEPSRVSHEPIAANDPRLQVADAFLEKMAARGLAAVVRRSRRLATIATALAHEFGVVPRAVEDIHFGALLHDVGLLLQPDPVPEPGTPLSAEERYVLGRHPLDGADLLRCVPLLARAAPLVENHHERHDGHGYPGGLIGAEIPIAARVFAVAEAFDAMLRGRRDGVPTMGVEEALEAVEAGAGQRFDPHVTAALAPALPAILRAARRRPRRD